MFTSTYNYRQQDATILNEQQKDIVEIASDFNGVISKKLESIVFSRGKFHLVASSENDNSYNRLSSIGYLKFKVVPKQYAKDYSCYYTPDKIGRILEIKNSKFINDIKSKVKDKITIGYLENAKHFIIPLQNTLIELVATNINVETTKSPISKPPLRHEIKNMTFDKDVEILWHSMDHLKKSRFETCTTPLEEFVYDSNNNIAKLYIDDDTFENEQRHELTFNKLKKIEFITTDLGRYLTNYYSPKFLGHILKKENSKDTELKELENTSDFILPLQDNFIKVLAEDIYLKKSKV